MKRKLADASGYTVGMDDLERRRQDLARWAEFERLRRRALARHEKLKLTKTISMAKLNWAVQELRDTIAKLDLS